VWPVHDDPKERMTMTERRPVGYIRRSKVDAGNPGDISEATQTAAISARAAIDGATIAPADVLADWGRSGRRSKRRLREAYGRLVVMIEADEVSTIYAYNWSRLGRSTRDILDLAELCNVHGTAIVTATGQSVDTTKADGRMLLSILTAVDEWQAEVQSERTAGQLAEWRETHPGDGTPHEVGGSMPKLGAWKAGEPCLHNLGRANFGDDPSRPGEDAADVLAAFDEAGSFLGAAKLLTARGVPTRLGKPWDTTSVSRIVRRYRPDVPKVAHRGMSAVARWTWTGLLHCACGTILTSMPRPAGHGNLAYYCRKAHTDSAHPRPYVVSGQIIQAWAEHELASMTRLVKERGTLPDAGAVQARLADLDTKRERIVDAFMDGTIDKPERDRRLGLLAADRARSQATLDVSGPGRLFNRPWVDWTLPPAEVNAAIRGLWSALILNGAMRPKRAVWVPTDDWGEDGPE
jgi:Resolvase, N terminal domain